MRTAFMFTMTAVVGGIVAGASTTRLQEGVPRKLAWLGIVATLAGAAMLQWYLATLPETAEVVLENRLPAASPWLLATVLAARWPTS
jgi:hypothetical protein